VVRFLIRNGRVSFFPTTVVETHVISPVILSVSLTAFGIIKKECSE
jgi:hypothetical protein